jgi:transcriptional regulator with XRE-family HTH domain
MRMWGCIHKRLRLGLGLSYEQVADFVGYSPSLVMSIERGVRKPSPEYVKKADELLRADGLLVGAAEYLARERLAIGSRGDVEEEGRARVLWVYDTHVLHPLLRTESYALSLLLAQEPVLSDGEIEGRMASYAERQARIAAEPFCAYSFILEESVLLRPVGDERIMREQRENLLRIAATRNVTLQVIPTERGVHTGLCGPVAMVRTPEHRWYAFLNLHDANQFVVDPEFVGALHTRYCSLRGLALSAGESAALIRDQLTAVNSAA